MLQQWDGKMYCSVSQSATISALTEKGYGNVLPLINKLKIKQLVLPDLLSGNFFVHHGDKR